MKQILVIVVIAIATVIANPVKIDHNKIGNILNVKLGLHASASNNVNANVVSAALALLNQQAAIVAATGAASGDENDKVSFLKDMLRKKIDLPAALQAASSNGESFMSEANIMKQVEAKLAQLKQKVAETVSAPEEPRIPEQLAKLPEKYAERMKNFKLPENFKIPASVKLPEKFMHRMGEIKQL